MKFVSACLLGLLFVFPSMAEAGQLGAIAGLGCTLDNPPRLTNEYSDFETWLGRPLERLHAYMASSPKDWRQFHGSAAIVLGCRALYAPQGKKFTLSVPMLVAGATLAEGAAGQYDDHFKQLGEELVARGFSDASLRIGWEFNGGWYFWAARKDPTNWVAYFRRIVQVLKATPGSHFTIDWCPNYGHQEIAPDQVYPGDDVVDYIGMDVYDQSFGGSATTPDARWNGIVTKEYGLNWLVRFAAEHHKRITIPEWGVSPGDTRNGSGDDPDYIRHMADFFAAHDVVYQFYFDIDEPGHKYGLENFPQSKAAYKAAFGK